MKRTLLAIFAVFITWSVLDFVIHGMLLQATYEATAHLWRPMEEMDMPLMYAVTLVYSVCFVLIYSLFVSNKSVSTGVQYGMLFGIAAGVAMGFGSYSYMPIPLSLAVSWFAGTLVEIIIGGALLGVIVKPD